MSAYDAGKAAAKRDLRSLTFDELKDVVVSLGQPAYRAKQVFSWLHEKKAGSYEAMSNVPKKLRDALAASFSCALPSVEGLQRSNTDGTVKFLFSFEDGALCESVLMKYGYGWSLCISTQVGCRMGCRFCASGLNGLDRNLSAGEMAGEVYAAENEEGVAISHIVLMGTGEPLDNYDEVVSFIRIITDERGKNLGGRHIALSTCGLVPKIDMLAKEELPLALALSLHAPNDAIRREIMPVANRYTIDETVGAMRRYALSSGRRVTFEYAVIRGVNDSVENAAELAERLRGIPCLVNLIPVNPVAENSFRSPTASESARFKKSLEKYGINVTIRREMGRDIDGACGQLRYRTLLSKHS